MTVTGKSYKINQIFFLKLFSKNSNLFPYILGKNWSHNIISCSLPLSAVPPETILKHCQTRLELRRRRFAFHQFEDSSGEQDSSDLKTTNYYLISAISQIRLNLLLKLFSMKTLSSPNQYRFLLRNWT